jgi:hypothetical protein
MKKDFYLLDVLFDLNLGPLLASGLTVSTLQQGMAIYAVDNEEEMSPAERKQKRTNLKEIIKQDFIDVWTVDNGHANHFLCDDFRT